MARPVVHGTLSLSGPRRPAFGAPVSSNVRPRMATLVALQQNQRLSACAKQPPGGEAANSHPNLKHAVVVNEPRQDMGRTIHKITDPGLRFTAMRMGQGNGLPCGIGTASRSGARREQSVCWAAAISSGVRPLPSLAAVQEPGTPLSSARSGRQLRQGEWSSEARLPWASVPCQQGAARPNPSLKRSANGRPPGPRGAVVYPAPRGPGALPLSPA